MLEKAKLSKPDFVSSFKQRIKKIQTEKRASLLKKQEEMEKKEARKLKEKEALTTNMYFLDFGSRKRRLTGVCKK